MKKIITGFAALLLGMGSLSAHVITVSSTNLNISNCYTSLQAATNAAKQGDTIYVMGSSNNYGNDTIKTPHITLIGDGFYTTGTEISNPSSVTNFYLNGKVNGIRIQGFNITQNIVQVGGAVAVDSVDIENCFVYTNLNVYGSHWLIRYCNLNNLSVNNNTSTIIRNNFLEDIEGGVNSVTDTIDHNDFVDYGGNVTSYSGTTANAVFMNNVFYYGSVENTTSCQYYNNLVVSSSVVNLNNYIANGNTGAHNLYSTTNPGWADAAIPANVVTNTTVWNYYWNFSPTAHAYDSATDGTQIGAYGGGHPIPNLNGIVSMPIMQSLSATGSVSKTGNITVNYKAQGKMAHGVLSGEYFFDTDPGTGLGTAFVVNTSNTDSAVGTFTISASSLTVGFHTLAVRVEDSVNVWSTYLVNTIYVQGTASIPSPPSIVAAEYFIDKDPGQGKGTPITTGTADTVNITQSISLSSLGLTSGYHNLFIRVENANGQWSLYAGRNFYVQPSVTIPSVPSIVAAEYFVDKDPGQGNGTPIVTGTADTVNIVKSISISSMGVSAGYHNLFIRTENANGQWSLYAGRNFYVQPAVIQPPPAPPIVAAEYFFDKDPGQGNGKSITVTKGDSVLANVALSVSSLTAGYHNAFIRVEDSTGVWSLYAGRNFYVQPTVIQPPPSSPIVAAEYFFDTDPGQGKGTPLTGITSADTVSLSTTLNSTALAIGNHNAFIRVMDSAGHWSLYAGRAFKVANCSDIVTVSSTKDSCFGGSDGTATAIASGGTGTSYTYSWNTNPVQTTSVATGLAAGVYSVTVLDSIGCPATNTVVVGQPAQITIKTSTSPATCGQINGQASVTKVTGGTGTKFTYEWSTVPVQTTQTITGLAPGTYTVTVTDQNKCSNTATVTVGSTVAPTITVTSVIPSLCGEHIGAASVSVSGGAPPYIYSWNNGVTVASADSLHSGNYIVTVIDTNKCSTFASIVITNSDGPTINSNGISNVKCYGQSNGSINIVVSGGTAPITYAWSTGATTQNISNLPQGPYNVTVTDATGCSSIKTFTIGQPTSPLSGVANTVNSDCSTPDGTGTVTVTGGTSPYTYNWSSGSTTSSEVGLGAGTYTVAITDVNGCVDSVQAAVSSKNGPVVKVDSTIASTCASGGKGTGSVIITVTGGTGSDTYLWSNASASTTQNLTNAPAGTYNVMVTDQVGCSGTASATISEVAPPAIPICMVTVDTMSQHNMVIWDKSLSGKSIASYNIYKETTVPGLFNLIGNVPITSGGSYVDMNSNPNVQSWRYEISQVDSCGFESPLSAPHKTMHLTINPGINDSTYNLIWDNYQGLAFNYYIIYRDTALYQTHDSVGYVLNNGTYTYTLMAPHTRSWYFHVDIHNPNACMPNFTVMGTRSVEAVNYNASKSNSGNVTFNPALGINALNADLNSLNVFPNPSTGIVNFTMNLTSPQSINLKIYNELGQVLSSTDYGKLNGHINKELNLSGLSKGVYILKVTGQNGSTYKKVVLQ